MIIEASALVGSPVRLNTETTVGQIDLCVVDGKDAQVAGWQIVQPGLVKRFAGLLFDDVAEIHRDGLLVDSPNRLQKNLRVLDELYKTYGPVLKITAKTESAKRLGRVTDIYIDTETGLITRFLVRGLLHERIIPRQFLVSITPKAIIFKDVVDQPIFDQVAVAETT